MLTVLLIAATGVPQPTVAATFTWTGARGNGSWASQFLGLTNWSGNLMPPSDAATGLEFNAAAPTLVLTNDLGNPFLLNRLVVGGDPFTLTGGTLQFVSNGTTTPTIEVNTSTLPKINAPLVLAAPTTIRGTGPLTVNGGVSGAGSLTASVPITFGGGTVSLTGGQTYAPPITLSGNTTLTSTGGADITTGQVTGGAALDVNTSGTSTLGQLGLISLSTDAGGSTRLTAAVTTTGSQTYNDPVTLAATDVTLSASNAVGGVTFFQGVSGAANLTVNTPAPTRFGSVGASTPLVSLTTDAPGTTEINGGGVTTTGGQTYGDPVLLGSGATLTSTGGGNIAFASTVNGASTLAVATTGNVTFGGPVGAATPLFSVSVAGASTISGGGVRTTGPQTYNGNVTIGGVAATLTSLGGGNVAVNGGVNGASALTVNTGAQSTLGGFVGGTTPLASLITDAPGSTAINGGGVTTTGAQTYNDAVTLGASTTLTSTGAGDVKFGGTLNGAFGLTVNTAGTTTFGGAVGGATPPTGVQTDAAGTTRLGGNVTTVAFQQYNDPVVLTGDVAVSTSSSIVVTSVQFANTVDGPFTLSVSAPNLVRIGTVGGTNPLAGLVLNVNGLLGGAVTAGSIKQTAGIGTTLFGGPLHATGAGGIDLTGNGFSLAALQSDTGPIKITNTGTATVSGAIGGPVGLTKAGAGTLTLAATNTYNGVTTVDGGTLRVTGSVSSSNEVHVGAGGTFEAASNQVVPYLTVADGGRVVVSAGVLQLGSTGAKVPMSLGGVLDVTTRGVIVAASPNVTPSALHEVGLYVLTGTITSSSAAADPTRKAVAYALAGDVLGPSGGTFFGVPVNGSAVLVRYTLFGDATLDGGVDFNDLVRLAQHYNTSGDDVGWADGDFTGDGTVDFNDLVKLAQNYNTTLPAAGGAAGIPGAPAGFAADAAAAFASVPEPCAAAFASLSLGLARRRRRR